jgi:stage II sporulation SpoAA-like protein
MPLRLEFDERDHLLHVQATGQATLDDVLALIDTVSEVTLRNGQRRVLVNLLGVDEGLKFTDHFSVGEHVARKLAHLDKLASVVPPARKTGTSEKVANKQGARLKVFTSETPALEWLAA